jgi:hypothetical protein
MKRNKKAVVALAAAALSGALFTGPAMAAHNDSGFAALDGVTAQRLSAQEMQSIAGELNAYDIAAALTAEAAKLSQYPQLSASLLKLAAYYTTNATQINNLFMKLHIYTAQ